MPDFTVKNLMDVESSAGEHSAELDARFARKHLGSRELGVSYFRYAPGFRYPEGHRHRQQEEAYVVIGGSGRVKLDEEIVEVGPWDVVRVAPEVARAFEAGPDGLELIAVSTSKPEGGDGVQVEGFWES